MADLKRGQKVSLGGEDAEVAWVGPTGVDLKMTLQGDVQIVRISKSSPEYSQIKATNSYANGRQRAENAIASRMNNATREMAKAEILKRAREGRWELLQDIDGKRNGDHIEVRMPNGNTQHIRIEG